MLNKVFTAHYSSFVINLAKKTLFVQLINNPIEKFCITVENPLWELKVANNAPVWVMLSRDPKDFKVYLHIFDTLSQKFLLEKYLLEQKYWWGGAICVEGEIVLLYAFQGSQNPDMKNMAAFDFVKKTWLWEIEGFSYVSHGRNFIKGTRFIDNQISFETVNFLSGDRIDNEQSLLRKHHETARTNNNIIVNPFHYPEDSAYFKSVQTFLLQNKGISAVKAVDYLEFHQVVIISYYLCVNEKLDNYLLVIDVQGREVLHVLLDETLEGLGKGTFFIFNNDLVFFKNKNQICSYVIHETY